MAATAVVTISVLMLAAHVSERPAAIRAHTAAALLCAGLALIAAVRPSFGTLGTLLSAATVAIGLIALAQMWRAGVSGLQILPVANLGVLLAGGAGLVCRWRNSLASAMAGAVAFIGVFGIVSALYRARIHVGGTPVPPMTLATAIVLTLWAAAFLLQHAAGPAGVVLKADRWGKTARQVAAVVTVTPIVFGLLCYLAIEQGAFDHGLALAMLATGTAMTLVATVVWVTARRREEDLRAAQILSDRQQAEALYRTIVETSQEGIYVVDANGRIAFANGRLGEMIGCEPAELIGTSMHDLLVEAQRPDAEERFSRYQAGRGSSRADVQLLRRDGNVVDAIKSSTALFDGAGELTGVVVLVSDVTDRMAARRALENAYKILRERVEELEGGGHPKVPEGTPDLDTARRGVVELARQLTAANAELETFSYSVSHDLRAPLRGIDGFSRELERDYSDRLDERGQHYLTRIRIATGRMSRLIDDLLDLARLSRKPMNRSVVDLTGMATSVVRDLREGTPGRDIEVRIQEGMTAYGDAHLLRIVFENLLGNAVKFTARRPDPVIEVGTDEDGAIFVRDNGVGFDPVHADKLFAPFQRLHTAEFEGTGIGLAIVQRIVHRHGGTIRADAAPLQGATFTVTLGQAERRAV